MGIGRGGGMKYKITYLSQEVYEVEADWFEANKDNLGLEIWMYIYNFDKHKNDCDSFCMFMNDKSGKQLETLISMQYGYYVQKEASE
ncbi:hypothetical protein DVB96_08195 [Listeria monocytogenes]|nr:hypothetical protein [Listeria monocytogenes]HAC3348402.1 hypothetical protein [Listeria monocytogenes]